MIPIFSSNMTFKIKKNPASYETGAYNYKLSYFKKTVKPTLIPKVPTVVL